MFRGKYQWARLEDHHLLALVIGHSVRWEIREAAMREIMSRLTHEIYDYLKEVPA